jgi:hypothetical protein
MAGMWECLLSCALPDQAHRTLLEVLVELPSRVHLLVAMSCWSPTGR